MLYFEATKFTNPFKCWNFLRGFDHASTSSSKMFGYNDTHRENDFAILFSGERILFQEIRWYILHIFSTCMTWECQNRFFLHRMLHNPSIFFENCRIRWQKTLKSFPAHELCSWTSFEISGKILESQKSSPKIYNPPHKKTNFD